VARIFISHSSANNDRAIQLRDWLVANGWDDIFLDLDPERGIAAGERWKKALQRAAQRCEVVLALISPEWLASAWCRPELNTAQLMGKKIIVLLIGSKPSEIPGDLRDAQYVDLIKDPDAYTRVKVGLKRIGLDPWNFSFAERRRPYPGFPPFEEDDAAIYFGRDAQIVRGLDKLRRLARTGVEHMLIILGASGCGKSSFLRAGLWPRLKRDDSAWLPLPTIRPERAVISGKFGLVEALYRVTNEAPFADKLQKQGLPRSRADIEEFVTTSGDGLVKILTALREAGSVPGLSGEAKPPPTIVIPIDQGEELFNEEDPTEAKRFIDLLSKTLAADPRVLALLTMRTDSFPQVQNDNVLAALPKDTFTLDKMLEGSYREVIEGPAGLVKPTPLKFDPQLTEALLQDAAGQDALALLAFTLRYLYDKYQANNELSLEGYEKLGRLKGVIETTVKQAVGEGAAKGELPKDERAQLALIRVAFVPHLARVNPAGQFVRRIATRTEIPPEARPLIDRLAEARLLIKDRRKVGGEDADVVEVAHEALLREWKDLNAALVEEREFLVAKGQLEQDVAEYRKTADEQKKGALIAGNKLVRAREWLTSRPEALTAEERQFIQISLEQEDAVRRAEELRIARERRNLQRVRWALIAFFVAVMAALGGALRQSYETSRREAAVFASEAESAFHSGLCDRALRMAEAALPPAKGASPLTYRSVKLENDLSEFASSPQCPFRLAFAGHKAAVLHTTFSPDGTRVVTASADGTGRVWDAASGSKIATLSGHQGPVNIATFSPDGSLILTASDDKTARLWDAASGAALATFSGHVAPVNFAAFSPDGHHIVTASDDKTARVWDADTRTGLFTLEGHERRVRTAAFSPDGARIVTASNDNTARLWNAKTGAAVATLSGHTDWVRTAAFSPDGSRIVTASEDKTARLWDGVTGAALATLSGHAGYVVSAAFSPDGNRVVTTSFDKTARLWDSKTGDTLAILSGHDGRLNSAVFAQDGQHVVTASEDKTARIWDAATGVSLVTLAGHGDKVWSAAFNPDGSRVVTGSADTTARLWDCTNVLIATLSGHRDTVRSAVFSPDGDRIVTASYDGTARLWDGRTGGAIVTLVGHQYRLRGAAVFSPDSARVVTVSFDNTARLWNAKTGARIAVLTHGNWVRSAAFSPDGNLIVTVSDDKIVRLWDGKTGAKVAEFVGHNDRVYDATFSPDGRILATAAYDDARLWDVKTGAALATLVGHTGRVNNISFSPDGSRVVTSSEDKTARLWDGKTGAPLAIMIGHGDAVYGATFSPDGSRVLTASFDSTARLWDGKTGAALMTLSGHGGPVNSAAFSPGGGRIVTASFDNTARVWNAATGKSVVILAGHSGSVNTAVFSSDGERIVTASEDGTARLWNAVTARKWERDPINQVPSSDRQDYVCRERLIGVQAFTVTEMQDPVLLDRTDLQNPCRRIGMLTVEYYSRVFHLK
jgi:WD40 repeat protein